MSSARSRSCRRADEVGGTPRLPGSLQCWLALSPSQAETLLGGGEIEPDPFSQRFGLRETAESALKRATAFMGWRPRGESQDHDPKTFKLCVVSIPAAGYMHMMEEGRLDCRKEAEWRLYGNVKNRETTTIQGVEVLLYEVGPEVHDVV